MVHGNLSSWQMKNLCTGYFFYVLQNLKNKIVSCKKIPQSLACFALLYIFKAILGFLMANFALI